jgi:diguanylate cyclase (GGDEF)-like protein
MERAMSLPALGFRSLQARIVLVFIALLLAVQLAGYTSIHNAITDNARRHAQDELGVGERVFNRLLAQNTLRLLQTAQSLAADFALREALATRDEPAIAAILRRHPQGAGADLAMLVGANGQAIAGAHGARNQPVPEPIARYVARAVGGERAPAVAAIGDAVYQLVALPVRPAAPMGWVVIGLRLDERVVRDLAALTSLEVSLAAREGADGWRLLASTRAAERHEALVATIAPASAGAAGTAALGTEPGFASRMLALDADDGIAAVLQSSLEHATAPFKELQAGLLVLTLVGLMLAALGSIVVVRRVTRPLAALVDAARKVEEGDYEQRVEVAADDEIGELASAFNLMCDGIAAREHKISELAYADTLTGLPNRALFNDRIGQAVRAAERRRGQLAVLTMDLDRFKHVNDTLGHHMGDLLLREVAFRLHRALQRRTDTIARLGGDEFAVLLPTEGVEGAELVARKVVEVLSEPFSIEGNPVDVGASTGIAVYPEHGEDADTLMRRADVAMYSAKRAGTGFEIYDSRHDQNTPARLSLLGELRHAVEHDQLALVFQPRISLGARAASSAEALVRWHHPERGVVLPERFVPFAEQTGYIKAVTRWVLDSVLRQCAAWHARGIELRAAVNISARDLHTPDFPRLLADLAATHGMRPDAVSLEVTESAVMDDPAHALEILERLHAMGVRLSIDDFGTGYSSLAYLKRLPVDELKIDKSFVIGLARDRDDAAIVRATIDLAHHMGLSVTAEGVEEPGVLETLRRLGCDQAQGDYISPPVPAAALERWFRQQATARAEPTAAALLH